MNNFLRFLFLTIALLSVASPLHAAPKEKLVLMPLRIPAEEKSLEGAMVSALVKGLQQKYEVFSGEQVQRKARDIFNRESTSAKKDCDETRCIQDIAMAFQAELIASASITKRDGGYFISLTITNVLDNAVLLSESATCRDCDEYAVIDKLKELIDDTPEEEPSSEDASLVDSSPIDPSLADPSPMPSEKKSGDHGADLWMAIEANPSIDDYQLYIEEYPQGSFVALARNRIKKLQREAEEETAQKEKITWDNARKQNTESDYNDYLARYPSGTYSALAKAQLRKLATEAEAEMQKAAKEAAKEAKQAEESGGEMGLVAIPGKRWKMMKYEVTFQQWDQCIAAGGCTGLKPKDEGWGRASRPVININYNEMQEYIRWLNSKSVKKYRLPTEEEWEYAARGGTATNYWWGSAIGRNNANCDGCRSRWDDDQTAPVGSFKANPYGLFDVSGNVWEMTESCWEGNCVQRVIRGGSWAHEPEMLTLSHRNKYGTSIRRSSLGFRLVQDM